MLDFWTVGYHTFPTREKKKRTERDTLKKELLIFWSCWIFQGCFMIVYILMIRKFAKIFEIAVNNLCHRRNLWFDVWVFFLHRRETLEVTRPLAQKAGREGPSVQCTVSSYSGKQQLYSCSIQNTLVIWQEKNLVNVCNARKHLVGTCHLSSKIGGNNKSCSLFTYMLFNGFFFSKRLGWFLP